MKDMDEVKKVLWRGNLMWEERRMMLPEHKQAWIELQRQEEKVPLHGELDDDQWCNIGEIIMDALNHALIVKLTFWKDGYYVEIECYIYKVDELNKLVRIEYVQDDSTREWIDMRTIYDVERV